MSPAVNDSTMTSCFSEMCHSLYMPLSSIWPSKQKELKLLYLSVCPDVPSGCSISLVLVSARKLNRMWDTCPALLLYLKSVIISLNVLSALACFHGRVSTKNQIFRSAHVNEPR